MKLNRKPADALQSAPLSSIWTVEAHASCLVMAGIPSPVELPSDEHASNMYEHIDEWSGTGDTESNNGASREPHCRMRGVGAAPLSL